MHVKATERKPENVRELLVCQMAKGSQEYRASLVEIDKKTKTVVKEVSFYKAKELHGSDGLIQKINAQGGIDLSRTTVQNGFRCKKGKTTGKLMKTKQQCGKIKKYDLSQFTEGISKLTYA